LVDLYNLVIRDENIPKNWDLSEIIILHKKGERSEVKNYRPISLGPTVAKIFSKIIVNRINNTLMAEQPKEQAGFRRNFSTIDNLFVLNQVPNREE